MGLKALIFDVDGTLAETERAGHRMAFNDAFAAVGKDWFWDEGLYGELLSVGGGRERIEAYIRYYQNENLRGKRPLISKIHAEKGLAYTRRMENGEIPLRRGIARLFNEARRQGLKLAVATNSSSISLGSLTQRYFNKSPEELFDVVVCGDELEQKKPAPEAYQKAIERLGLQPEECIAFEDSQVGLRAADIMHVPTVVTVSEYTTDEDFSQAALVISDLGERNSPSWVMQDPYSVTEAPCFVDVPMLRRINFAIRERREPQRLQLQPANRAKKIQPFHVMRLLEKAKQMEADGKDVIHLEVGEPDFPTPAPVISAAEQALKTQTQKYTAAGGLPELRQAIASYYQSHYGATVKAEQVFITPGASGALQLALASLIDTGDEVLLTDPGYPCNEHLLELAGAKVKHIVTKPKENFQITANDIQNNWTDKTRGIMLASPSNPTGSCYSAEKIQSIYQAIERKDGWLLMDEIYHGLEYHDQKPFTAASINSDRVFTVNSFSKYFSMTGWRLGWLVVPLQFAATLEKLAQNMFLAPSSIAQYAALAAFEPETLSVLEAQRASLQQRRDYLSAALSKLGFEILGEPQGAFYLYTQLPKTVKNIDAEQFCQQLLESTGVAITPGLDFAANESQRNIRFAYACDIVGLEKAVQCIEQFIKKVS